MAQRADERLSYLNDLDSGDGTPYDVIRIAPVASVGETSVSVVYDYSDIYPGMNDYNSDVAFDAIAQEFSSDTALGESVTVSVRPLAFDSEEHDYTVILNRALVARYVRCHGPQETIHGKEACILRLVSDGQDLYFDS